MAKPMSVGKMYGGRREVSPDISLFSPTSASADRCSVASDSQSLTSSDLSSHLPHGGGAEGGSAGDNYQEAALCLPSQQYSSRIQLFRAASQNRAVISTANVNAKQLRNGNLSIISDSSGGKDNPIFVAATDSVAALTTSNSPTSSIQIEEDDNFHHLVVDSARNSFSIAVKECQERRSRIDVGDYRRPAILDLNNVNATASVSSSSGTLSRRSSGNFPSPGTPTCVHHHRGTTINKGWISERAPPPTFAGNKLRNHHGVGPNPPLNWSNASGRVLPSKWEDAERWIISPGSNQKSHQLQWGKRPKSKSGPLGPSGFVYHGSLNAIADGSIPVYGAEKITARVQLVDSSSPFFNGTTEATSYPEITNHLARNEPCMARSVSVHGCSEVVALQFTKSIEEGRVGGFKDAATDVSCEASQRDMATQMSPLGSGHSSPARPFSLLALSPSTPPISELDLQPYDSVKVDVRDVQIDDKVTFTRWSKRQRNRKSKNLHVSDDWNKKPGDFRSSGWDISGAAKIDEQAKREEAKIDAWEKLQKAKAEKEIRKLEMKLEKKRSSSMDKIMSKLRSAQKRAQEMRSSVVSRQRSKASEKSGNEITHRRTRQMGSLSGCFACHAF